MVAKVAAEPDVKPGDMIVIESERVGQPSRKGEIVAIHRTPLGHDYEVRWDDGHLTSIRPAAGSARFVHTEKAPKKK